VSEELVRIFEYKDIGKVSFIRKDTVRNLKITIKPMKGVQVTMPRFVSIESAGKFVEEKRSWIKKSQLKLNRYENKTTVFDGNMNFQTRDHILILDRHARSVIRTVIGQGKVFVTFPEFADVHDPRIQNAIRKAIVRAWHIEAAKYLPSRVDYLAKQHELNYNSVTVRENKSRWGSCSRDNKINLNIHLMRLPQHLCDYIILHELAHIIHKHHQKAFWNFLDAITGGQSRKLDKEMNRYSPEIW
jgi:hypothetical protein